MLVKFGFKTYEVIKDFTPIDQDRDVALVTRKNKTYLVSKYIQHFDSSIKQLINLRKFGVPIPKIYKVNNKEKLTLEEYIPGETMMDVLQKEDISEKVIEKLFEIYRFCRFSKFELDYYPDYYKFYNKKLYYMGRSMYKQDQDHNLENYGFKFWLPSREANERMQKVIEKRIDKSRLLSDPEVNKKTALCAIKYW